MINNDFFGALDGTIRVDMVRIVWAAVAATRSGHWRWWWPRWWRQRRRCCSSICCGCWLMFTLSRQHIPRVAYVANQLFILRRYDWFWFLVLKACYSQAIFVRTVAAIRIRSAILLEYRLSHIYIHFIVIYFRRITARRPRQLIAPRTIAAAVVDANIWFVCWLSAINFIVILSYRFNFFIVLWQSGACFCDQFTWSLVHRIHDLLSIYLFT